MSKRKYTDEQLIDAVAKVSCMRELLISLNVTYTGNNFASAKNRINILQCDISHWTRKGSLDSYQSVWNKRPLHEILVENSKFNSNHLRLRLIKENVFEHKCYECDGRVWRGKPIPLQLEHKNGNPTDNRIENLTLLCPNCHAQTDTYCGKNKHGNVSFDRNSTLD